MTLFDPADVDPAKTGPRFRGDSDYYYLSTTNRDGADSVRSTLEEWFTEYPPEHKKDLARRFRGGAMAHKGAFFELVLFATFRAMGAQVIVSPEVEGGRNRPDLHVTLPNGQWFYVEDRVVTGMTEEDVKREQVKDKLLRKIELELHTDNYWWGVEVESMGTRLRQKHVLVELAKHAQTLSWQEVMDSNTNPRRLREFEYVYRADNWVIRFEPIARRESDTEPGTHIAMEMF